MDFLVVERGLNNSFNLFSGISFMIFCTADEYLRKVLDDISVDILKP